MNGKAKRVICAACNFQIGRLGWEAVCLPRTAKGCQALQKVVWGENVPENLKPCFQINVRGRVSWETTEAVPLPRGFISLPDGLDFPDMEVSELSIRFGGSKRAREALDRRAKNGR